MAISTPSCTMMAASPPSFWQRYLLRPVIAQLQQGISSDKIAQTIAVGAACGIFPVLGGTTLVCLAAGALLRLNQPILQLVNYIVYPLQLALILVFIRIGEWFFHAPALSLSVSEMLGRFRLAPLRFFSDFAMTFVYCITAWFLVAPILAAVIYFAIRPLVRRFARRFAFA